MKERNMNERDEQLWADFAKTYQLTDKQLGQFQRYYQLLCEVNEQIDLTTIVELPAALAYHFADSLELGTFINFTKVPMLADVGSGAGFPGLALKIKYPMVPMVLIEVTQKRIDFLRRVIDELGLTDIEVYPLDWRTFLRKTSYERLQQQGALFCARASLHPDELIRLFQPSCPYKHATLVYWAAGSWVPEAKEKPFLQKEFLYTTKHKKRKYVLFGLLSSKA